MTPMQMALITLGYKPRPPLPAQLKFCVMCGKAYNSPIPHSKTCSDECSRKRNIKLSAQRKGNLPNDTPKQCSECGKTFTPISVQVKTCGPVCKLKRTNKLRRALRASR
jgi:predicted Zn-ribbon and HTH transcriptional regulator